MANIQPSILPAVPQPAHKAIELLRVSTDAQAGDDRASIPAQKEICRRIARQHGLEIVETIEMVDVSGTAVLYAPEMKRLLELIQRFDIHGVVAREFSRLMRPENYGDFAILQAFAESRTLLYLPDGPIDFASKTGRLMGTIRAAIAGLERSEILERITGAKEQMRRQGRWPNSDRILPFGVGYNRKTAAWYYKPEAERVREIYRLFLAGEQNYDRLSEVLGLSRGTAKNILANRIYTGWMIYDEKRDLSPSAKRIGKDGRQGDRKKTARADDEIIRVRVIEEGLVSEADFERVQYLIQQKASRNLRMRQKVGLFTYNGFVWCADCGDRLHTFRNQFDRFYYICSNKKRKDAQGQPLCSSGYLNRDRLETKLDHLFGEDLTDHAFLRRLYEQQAEQAQRNGSAGRRTRLLDQLQNLQAKRQRVTDLFVDGEIGRDERLARLAHIDRDLQRTEQILATVAPVPILDAASLADLFSPFMEWPYLEREDKRRLLATLGPEIRVRDDYQVAGIGVGVSVDGNSANHGKMARFASRARPCL